MTSPEPKQAQNVFQRLDLRQQAPYTREEYLRRLAWEWVQRLFIRPSPRAAYGWRRMWLALFGAKLHPTSRTRPSTDIIHPWLLTMGAHAVLGDQVIVYNLGPITIGDHTAISQRAHLCAGTHDHRQPNLPLERPSIHIGSGVWICTEAFIGPGVTVGDNTIVAARAVVVKDTESAVIVAGNPARTVRQREMRPAAE